MPVMNGLEFLRWIRQEAAHKDIPVIIISTEGREEDTLPERLLTGKLSRAKLEEMIADYYRARDWSAEGVPPLP